MRKIARFFLWGIGSLVLIFIATIGVGEYIQHSKEERRFELEAAKSEDATELAKCASRILKASALRTMITRIYSFGGFEFRELARTHVKLGYPIPEPSESYFREVAMNRTNSASTEIEATIERCGTKLGYSLDESYWTFFWGALEHQPEFSAVLEKLKSENEEILAPYRPKLAARKKAEADEAQKMKDALYK